MEFVKGHIYGFGKFQNVPLEFQKGFQILFVRDKNEKDTLLQFFVDMFYGQKLSRQDKLAFTENFYKYAPWNTQDYRGNIVYKLDNGKIIHLYRVFGSECSLKIYEGLEARDITSSFSVYPNGEVAFVQNHLGIQWEVFSSLAIISDETINQLANHHAIQEHLLCLIDTGTTKWSVEKITNSFQEYLQSIGTERTNKKPWNAISSHRERLYEEYEQAKTNLKIIYEKKARLKESKELLNVLYQEKEKLEKKISYALQYALWRRKNDARALREKLDELTARSFALSNYRKFPIEQKSYVLQLEVSLQQLEKQKQQLQSEIEKITEEINRLEQELHHLSFTPISFISEYQKKYEEYLKHIQGNEEVVNDLQSQQEKVKEQIQGIEKLISGLPEPIQKDDMYYQKVDSVIDLYRSSLREMQRSELEWNELKAEYDHIEEEVKPYRELFADVNNFTELISDYIKIKDKPEEEQAEIEQQIQEAEAIKRNIQWQQPTHLILGSFCFLVWICLVGMFLYTGQKESIWFSIAVAIPLLYFLQSYITNRKRLREISTKEAELKEREKRIKSVEYIETHPITKLLHKASVEHPRELQGLYDEYCAWLKRLEEKAKQEKKAEQLFLINQSRTSDLYLEVQTLFEQIGITLENDGRLDYYRGKVFELQERARVYNRKLWDLKEEYQQLSHAISRRKENIQKIHSQIRDNILSKIGDSLIQAGLLKPDESLTLDTFHSYYQTEETYIGLKNRLSELRKKRLDLHQQVQIASEEIARKQEELNELLKSAEVSNISEWKSKCARAEEAYNIFSLIEQTQQQLQQILGEDTIEELEKCTQDFVPYTLPEDETTIQSQIVEKENEIEQIQQEIQLLQSEIGQISAKTRPLNEIIEEKEYYESQWRILKYEQESILLAISVLEQLATCRYQNITLPLQKEWSKLLAKLTEGKYSGILIDHDFTIKIIPADTGIPISLDEISPKKGILEQVYFAMRVALIKILVVCKETLPIILNDPFTKYDYSQLIQSLNSLKILGQEHQIILLTYRDDIPEIAKNMCIPIHAIENG